MAANNWEAGDSLTRSRMNQPFFMQSGEVSAGALLLRLSPGRLYFPHTGPLVRTVSQQVTAQGVLANTNYGFYITGDGTVRASGYSGAVHPPGAPMPNAQYLGTVQFGASATTANTRGPWTTPSGVFEGRGEYVAIDQAVPRVRVGEGFVQGGISSPATMRNNTLATVTVSPAVDLATVAVGEPANSYSVVHGHVTWTPSGSPGSFGMDVYVTKEGELDFATADTRQLVAQSGGLSQSVITTAFSYVSVVSGTGGLGTVSYTLTSLLDSALTSDAGASARIRSFALVVEPGRKTGVN